MAKILKNIYHDNGNLEYRGERTDEICMNGYWEEYNWRNGKINTKGFFKNGEFIGYVEIYTYVGVLEQKLFNII